MKTVSAGLLSHLGGETTTLATLWRLTRRDGAVMGFTDHDTDLTLNGIAHSAATGYTRTALTGDAQLSVDNMDLEGILAAGGLTADDIRAGLYDWAELRVSMVNYADLTQGEILLRRGRLGEFTLRSGVFVTELRGLSQALTRNFIRTYTADCGADLGDERCKVDLSLYRETGTVTSLTEQRRLFGATVTGARADGFFGGGLLTWLTGLNAGAKIEVHTASAGTIRLYLPTGEDITVGDTFELRAGCDKSVTMCKNVYDNIVNNRSFPFIPGADAVTRTPDAKPPQ
jgi:uncharacterized phage protein (TIGR02218 family)